MHIEAARLAIDTIREEYPDLFDLALERRVEQMLDEAIEVEMAFSEDALSLGISGLSAMMMKEYPRYCADQRLTRLGCSRRYWE